MEEAFLLKMPIIIFAYCKFHQVKDDFAMSNILG